MEWDTDAISTITELQPKVALSGSFYVFRGAVGKRISTNSS